MCVACKYVWMEEGGEEEEKREGGRMEGNILAFTNQLARMSMYMNIDIGYRSTSQEFWR